MKTMTINGIEFEVIRPRKYDPRAAVEAVKDCAGRDLSYYYAKPSACKNTLYHFWSCWAARAENVSHFGVCSANNFQFSNSALLHNDAGDVIGVITITRAHNRVHLFS